METTIQINGMSCGHCVSAVRKALTAVPGVTVGDVTAAMDPAARQKGYGCDVTYTTSKELLADFLRDRLRLGGIQNPTRRLIRRMLAPAAQLLPDSSFFG